MVIEVIDTGVGIEVDKISKLFKPYSSGGTNHNKDFGGTGLGLWISKVILDLMEGHIHCSSELGAGTKFRVEIPVSYYSFKTNS